MTDLIRKNKFHIFAYTEWLAKMKLLQYNNLEILIFKNYLRINGSFLSQQRLLFDLNKYFVCLILDNEEYQLSK